MPLMFGKLFNHRNFRIEDRNCMYTMFGCNASQWHWSAAAFITNNHEKVWRLHGTARFTLRSRFQMVSCTRLQVTFKWYATMKFNQSIENPFHSCIVMLLSPLDARHALASNANALAVMLTFAIIVKLNGIQIKRAMLHALQGKVQWEHHQEA